MTMRGDEGLTLAEMLIALLILGVGAIALVGAMGSLIQSSVTQKNFSGNDNFAKTYVEAAERKAAATAWSCDLDVKPTITSTTYQLTATTNWINAATGAVVADCSAFAEARCPAESSPYPAECTPGAVRISLTVTQLSTANRPQVTTVTETVVRRGNA